MSPLRLASVCRRVLFLLVLVAGDRSLAAYSAMQLALDEVGLEYYSSSTPSGKPWLTHKTATRCLDDTDGAEAPAMTAAGESWIEASVTGPETIDFMWALQGTSAQSLTCTVAGQVKAVCAPAGTSRWRFGSVTIPAGEHKVRWIYKQTTATAGKAWLDWVSRGSTGLSTLAADPRLEIVAGEAVDLALAVRQPAAAWEVYWDTLPPGLTLDPVTGRISGAASAPGTWRPLFRIWSGAVPLYYRVLFEVVDQPTLVSALDSPGMTFAASATDGGAGWIPQGNGGRDGGDCIMATLPPPVRTAPPFQPGLSRLRTTVNGPDVLSYWVKVATGRVRLYLDGREYRAHGPAVTLRGWERVWLSIPAGPHELLWEFEPYGQATPTAWLDDVRLRSDGRPFIGHLPVITLQAGGNFQFTLPSSGATAAWNPVTLPPGLTLNAGTGLLSGTPLERGVWTVPFSMSLPGGASDEVYGFIDASIPPPQALELPNTWWKAVKPAETAWYGQSTLSHDGSDAMRSPPTPRRASRSLITVIKGPATLSWWWSIPAGTPGDTCLLAINGRPTAAVLTGPSGWQQASVRIPDGPQEIAWRWTSDDAGEAAEECAIVDQATITP